MICDVAKENKWIDFFSAPRDHGYIVRLHILLNRFFHLSVATCKPEDTFYSLYLKMYSSITFKENVK